MDLGIIGLFDILIVIGFVIAVIVGLKKGFITSFLDITSGLFGFVFAVLLTKPLSDLIYHKFSPLKNAIYSAVEPRVIEKIGSTGPGVEVSEALEPLQLPGFLSGLISDYYNSMPAGTHTLTEDVSNAFTYILIILLSFVFLMVLLTIGVMLIKKVVTKIREESILFTAVDGSLGVVLGVVVFFVGLYIFLLILVLLLQMNEGLANFINTDMQLSTNEWRLSKFFYNYNLIGNLLKLFI